MNDRDIDLIIAAAMLPTAGIIVSPEIIKHELKSQKKWNYIFYTKGNLHNCKNDDDFYRMDNPVPFETSIFFAVIKQQVLGTVGVIAFIIVSIALTIFWITYGYNHMPDNLLAGLLFLGLRRKTGVMFFISVFLIAFSPAIASFYFTGFIYRLMIVMKRKYIACHAIVRKVDSGKISLSSDKYHYSYNYATCVGILEKNVHDSKANFGFAFIDKDGSQKFFVLETGITDLAVSRLQPALDEFIKANNLEIDYIHGTEEVLSLGKKPGATGILLPPIAKDSFFETINGRGPLPRKSFSMGEADEKRFYLECRKLFQ
jgi:hypothetical protein